jgi:Tol biopolymer transport system component
MKKIIFLCIIFFILFAVPVYPQYYFGKNKVQYTDFKWQVLTTQSFQIFFYSEEKEIAEIAGQLAEESYKILEDKFNHHIFKKIPLIIYSSPNYFEQTNVISSLLPENVAGFTEFFKGRMVIPFDGSYANFQKVIRHELVHVFSYEKLTYGMKAHRKYNYSLTPLWFDEGLAEHWSGKANSESEMIIKDLVLSGKLIRLDDLSEISGTYLLYKEGESFLNFLSAKYGDEKISMIFDNYWKRDSFSKVVELCFGKPLKQLGEEWEYDLKKRYFPEIASYDFPDKVAQKLTFDGINLKPTIFTREAEGKTEDWIAFKSNKLGYTSLYLMSPRGEKEKLITLVKGERSYEFESLHLLKSKIEASKSGKIAFISKRNEKDVLYIFDTKKMEMVKSLSFDSLVSLSSPSWSPGEQKIAFSGVRKDGYTDLYYVDLEDDSLFRLISDMYEDKDPSWSCDGERIAFGSDRSIFGQDGFQNLFLLDLTSKKITPLTQGKQNDINPSWSSDCRRIIFSSDRGGSFNLFFIDFSDSALGDNARQITDLVTGAFDPKFSDKEKSIVFTGFQDYSFQIYKIPFSDSLLPSHPFYVHTDSAKFDPLSWAPKKLSGELEKGVVKYKNKFSFDIAQSVIGYDAVYGQVGGFQSVLTDMLGNHQYFFLIGNSAQSKSDFLSSFNLGVTYLNKSRRLNYGWGLYHFYDEYYELWEDLYNYYTERQYGGLFFISYPFSKFDRIESSFYARQSDRDYYMENRKRKTFLSTNYISLIKDTALWDAVGPIDGSRINFTVGLTFGWDDKKVYNRLFLVDFRKYFRLRKNSCYAFRFMGFSSEGEEPQRYFLGGSWSLRGYSRRSFYGKNLVLVNNELRFPLIDNLIIGFPFGRIGFQAIRGALFFDSGNAWDKGSENLHSSFGAGARVSLGYVTVLRFDLSRNLDTQSWVFDFFFGWNF